MDRELTVLVTTDPYPWDPDAICDACGKRGTVARSHRRDVPESPMRRYCGECWPEQRADQMRHMVEQGVLYSTAKHDKAVTWDRLVALVAAVERVLPPTAPDDSGRSSRWKMALVAIASELSHEAGRLSGPMPQVVREFIKRRASRSA